MRTIVVEATLKSCSKHHVVKKRDKSNILSISRGHHKKKMDEIEIEKTRDL